MSIDFQAMIDTALQSLFGTVFSRACYSVGLDWWMPFPKTMHVEYHRHGVHRVEYFTFNLAGRTIDAALLEQLHNEVTAWFMKGMIFDATSVQQILAGNKTQSRRIIKGVAHSPRYREGETVYVKEAYADISPGTIGHDRHIAYKATDTTIITRWKTPLFMPESISRIKLQIVRVGIERAHAISGEDCIAEGITNCIYPLLWSNWRKRWIEVNGQQSWDSDPWVWVYEFARV